MIDPTQQLIKNNKKKPVNLLSIQSSRILILAKSIKGGTGTFFNIFLKNTPVFLSGTEVYSLILEKNTDRKFPRNSKISFFRSNKYYPIKYNLSFSLIKLFIREFLWIKNTIKEYKPDIILSIDTHCALMTRLIIITSFKNIKHIITIHNNVLDTLKEKTDKILFLLMKPIISAAFNQANKVICVSKHLSKDLKTQFNLKKIPQTIYYGVKVPQKVLTPSVKNKHKIILSMTRFVEQKDNETLRKAFTEVTKQQPNIRLKLVGDGPLKSNYRKLIKLKNIQKYVQIIKWQENPYIMLSKADIVVLSSRREGFPLILLESLKLGKPVIASDCLYGPREMLDGGKYGRLFPVGDINALKTNILDLLTNSSKYRKMQMRALERGSFFSVNKMMTKYKNIITALLQ